MASPKIKQVLFDFEGEGNYGKDPKAPKPYVLLAVSDGISATQNTKVDNVIGGDIDSGGEKYSTSVDVKGSLTVPMYYEQIGVILKVALGDPKTEADTTSTDMHTHTFKSTECISSCVIEDTLTTECNKDGSKKDFFKRFNGLKANTMNINASPEGDYHCEVDFVGATGRDNLVEPTLEKLDTANKIVLKNTRIVNKHAFLYINDSTEPYKLAKEFSFTIDRGTDAEKVLSAGAIVEDSQFLVTGSLNSIFDGDMYKKAMSQEKVKAKLVFTDGKNSLEFIMAEVQFSTSDTARSYGEKYPLNLEFSCSKTGDTDAKLKVVLKNTITSY